MTAIEFVDLVEGVLVEYNLRVEQGLDSLMDSLHFGTEDAVVNAAATLANDMDGQADMLLKFARKIETLRSHYEQR